MLVEDVSVVDCGLSVASVWTLVTSPEDVVGALVSSGTPVVEVAVTATDSEVPVESLVAELLSAADSVVPTEVAEVVGELASVVMTSSVEEVLKKELNTVLKVLKNPCSVVSVGSVNGLAVVGVGLLVAVLTVEASSVVNENEVV